MATLAAKTRPTTTRALEAAQPDVPTQLRGEEGAVLIRKSKGLLQRWNEYRQRGLVPSNSREDEYQPMRPKRSFTAHVEYKFRGRGKPLPYPIDEE